MGRRTLIELLHLAAGLGATAAVFAAGAWSYPVGARTVWAVGWVTMGAVLAMSVGPLRNAWLADHGRNGSDR